jgi:hypothetical protein
MLLLVSSCVAAISMWCVYFSCSCDPHSAACSSVWRTAIYIHFACNRIYCYAAVISLYTATCRSLHYQHWLIPRRWILSEKLIFAQSRNCSLFIELEALEFYCEPVKSSSYILFYCFCFTIIFAYTLALPYFFFLRGLWVNCCNHFPISHVCYTPRSALFCVLILSNFQWLWGLSYKYCPGGGVLNLFLILNILTTVRWTGTCHVKN